MSTEDKQLLKEISIQLNDWARESEKGGWSTHQVQPMRDLAAKIAYHIVLTTDQEVKGG